MSIQISKRRRKEKKKVYTSADNTPWSVKAQNKTWQGEARRAPAVKNDAFVWGLKWFQKKETQRENLKINHRCLRRLSLLTLRDSRQLIVLFLFFSSWKINKTLKNETTIYFVAHLHINYCYNLKGFLTVARETGGIKLKRRGSNNGNIEEQEKN